MNRPTFSRVCFNKLQPPALAERGAAARPSAEREERPAGSAPSERRRAAAPRNSGGGLTFHGTRFVFKHPVVSSCSCPVSHHRSFAQGQPRGRGTFLFSCSRLTQELVL